MLTYHTRFEIIAWLRDGRDGARSRARVGRQNSVGSAMKMDSLVRKRIAHAGSASEPSRCTWSSCQTLRILSRADSPRWFPVRSLSRGFGLQLLAECIDRRALWPKQGRRLLSTTGCMLLGWPRPIEWIETFAIRTRYSLSVQRCRHHSCPSNTNPVTTILVTLTPLRSPPFRSRRLASENHPRTTEWQAMPASDPTLFERHHRCDNLLDNRNQSELIARPGASCARVCLSRESTNLPNKPYDWENRRHELAHKFDMEPPLRQLPATVLDLIAQAA